MSANRWPKPIPELTPEQQRIRADFLHHWLQIIPQRYSRFERFGHRYVAARGPRTAERTLEIGAGLGSHVAYEDLSHQDYVALDPRPDLARYIADRHARVKSLVGDAQFRIPCPNATFDRVIAIHVLEHLPDLPAALTEVRRVLKPGGRLVGVIPCEGGWAYALGRRLSAQRIFERRYGQPYEWFIRSEHVSTAAEILDLIPAYLDLRERRFWPLRLPLVSANLVIGLTASKADFRI